MLYLLAIMAGEAHPVGRYIGRAPPLPSPPFPPSKNLTRRIPLSVTSPSGNNRPPHRSPSNPPLPSSLPIRRYNTCMHILGFLAGMAPSQGLSWVLNSASWVFCILILLGAWRMFKDVEASFEGDVMSAEYSSIKCALDLPAQRMHSPGCNGSSPPQSITWAHPPSADTLPIPVLMSVLIPVRIPLFAYRAARFYTMVLWNLFGCNMVSQNLRFLDGRGTEIVWLALDFCAKSIFSTLLVQGNFMSTERRRVVARQVVEQANRSEMVTAMSDALRAKDLLISSTSHELRTPVRLAGS